jgi:hypothetical protein
MAPVTEQNGRVTRADIEAKFRELKGEVDDTTEKAKPIGLAVAAGAGALVLGLVYVMGRRKGTKLSTVVEIRRV